VESWFATASARVAGIRGREAGTKGLERTGVVLLKGLVFVSHLDDWARRGLGGEEDVEGLMQWSENEVL
jgi:hypothetical protein